MSECVKEMFINIFLKMAPTCEESTTRRKDVNATVCGNGSEVDGEWVRAPTAIPLRSEGTRFDSTLKNAKPSLVRSEEAKEMTTRSPQQRICCTKALFRRFRECILRPRQVAFGVC
ncbi:hypothetical protein AMELA_G00119730 [Ameiurus melas]|uniref:Uncharacterized protein n=1 Tax=Ameiurus melas TaxID=219545 RepID=A0A7J6ALV1_AMEME|nr:hypothetical protein AMELA_G00119730 [Ameiurus melas]